MGDLEKALADLQQANADLAQAKKDEAAIAEKLKAANDQHAMDLQVQPIVDQWNTYATVKSTGVASLSVAAFAQALQLLLAIKNGSASVPHSVKSTLEGILIANVIFSGLGLLVTIAMVSYGYIKNVSNVTIGEWFKWANALVTICATAVGILGILQGSYTIQQGKAAT